MKSVTYTCDRCGEPAVTSAVVSISESGQHSKWAPYSSYSIDLCGACLHELEGFLKVEGGEAHNGS